MEYNFQTVGCLSIVPRSESCHRPRVRTVSPSCPPPAVSWVRPDRAANNWTENQIKFLAKYQPKWSPNIKPTRPAHHYNYNENILILDWKSIIYFPCSVNRTIYRETVIWAPPVPASHQLSRAVYLWALPALFGELWGEVELTSWPADLSPPPLLCCGNRSPSWSAPWLGHS